VARRRICEETPSARRSACDPLNRATWLCRGQFPLGSSVWTKGLENFFKSFYATHASADSPGKWQLLRLTSLIRKLDRVGVSTSIQRWAPNTSPKNYAAPWVGLLFRGRRVKLFRHLSEVLLGNSVFRHFIFNRLPNFVRKEGGNYSKVTFGL